MAYKASPRPSYTEPTHLRHDAVTRYLWGDPEAGEVADWIYVSTDKIHHLVWGLPPGGAFRHSSEFRTIFGADVIYHVLSGVMVIANPETGEVHRVQAGEAAFFRKDTWHHALNYGSQPLRVLEYFSPPPSQGTSGVYARSKPLLTEVRYCLDRAIGRWPLNRQEIQREFTIHIIRPEDRLWLLEGGRGQELLVGLLVSTEHLTVGQIELLPGQRSDVLSNAGDKSFHLLSGSLNILCPAIEEGQRWFELKPQDGFYLPAGTPHQLHNIGDTPVTVMFGVAPTYR
ncbi:MAG: cupin domain-containing protein [Bythopirellula sp.]|nr:cupin domain-containing protein [Bythopirellula sp.]